MAEISTVILIAVLIFSALALMALESFIPGVSIAGVIGALVLIIGVSVCWNAFGAAAGIVLLIVSACLAFLVMRMVLRSLKSGRLSRSGLFLKEESPSPVQRTRELPASVAVGLTGTARTALRPSGIAEFEGERLHVTSLSGFVESGAPIRVAQIEGSRILVEFIS